MGCFICQRKGNNINASGTCIECQRHACGPPPIRLDGAFHGDVCFCGCHKFVCEDDQRKHSSGHGNQTIDCFPGPSFDATLAALDAATRLDDSSTPSRLFDRLYRALNRFLNVVVPGTDSLWAVGNDMPDSLMRAEIVDDARAVVFQPDFLVGDSLRRCAGLAARTLIETMLRHDVDAIVVAVSAERRESIEVLLERHAGKTPPARQATAPIDDQWLIGRFETQLPAPHVLRALPVWDGALDAEAMVQWLVEPAADPRVLV